MKAIEDAIARLEEERAKYNRSIDGRIEGLQEALRICVGGPVPVMEPEVRKRARRGNLKETVLDLAQEAGEKGLTADECLTMAKHKGIELVPGSVSSLLSRLKTDGVMFFDGSRYRLKQYAGPRQAA